MKEGRQDHNWEALFCVLAVLPRLGSKGSRNLYLMHWWSPLVFLIALSSCTQDENRPMIFFESAMSTMDTGDLQSANDPHLHNLWVQLQEAVNQDAAFDFIDQSIDFPGRDPVHLRHENLSYDMARGICERLGRSALMHHLTKDPVYKERVLRQIEILFDDAHFPVWCDDAHMHKEPHVDIRTYRISMWIALCYNWLYEDLNEEERKTIIQGLDRKAIKPFWQKLAQKPGWYRHRHNWFTNMFGGMGITMMALGNDHPDTQRALDTIVPAMMAFDQRMGPQGEFNEPPGYAGAVRFQVEFAQAYRSYTHGQTNLLAEHPFPALCYWIMHHTLPPGHL
ncbi:MAG: hypothetical protein KTR24_16560, partial [Saprospiraceae bacterium]|nr:hypothetical protein [Saprospiraceae bacterium]